MLDEIAEQPAALEQTMAAEREKYVHLGNFLRKKDIDLVVIVARGSSDNASLFGRYLIEVTAGIPVSLSAPSVYTLYNAKLNLSRALVIVALAGLRDADNQGPTEIQLGIVKGVNRRS